MKVSSSLYQSSDALVSSNKDEVSDNWKVNLDVDAKRAAGKVMLAGTQSKVAQYSMNKSKQDKFSFTSQQVSCRYYSYRLSSKARLSSEFNRDLQNLPKVYNGQTKAAFYKLINTYGTHFIKQVQLGGRVHSVTSIRTCQAALQGLDSEEVRTCLDVEAQASVGGNSLSSEVKHCQEARKNMESKSRFSSTFNDRFTQITGGHVSSPELLFSSDKDPAAYQEWLQSLKTTPDIISYSLDALHELVRHKGPLKDNLRRAVSHYILEHALLLNCSARCPAGVKSNAGDPCACVCHSNPGVNSACCPTQKGLSQVTVKVRRAHGLYGDYTTATDSYVKVFLGSQQVGRTEVVYNNNDPRWGATFDLGSQTLTMGSQVKFEVWDEDNKWDDDQLGACEVPLRRGIVDNICRLNHGELYYSLQVDCAPSLGGPSCSEYVNTPMDATLQDVCVSRHAQPLPRPLLAQMGVVFADPVGLNASQPASKRN
ncbi:PERF protein, partial [Amia calva]|nr:PERF protein [Amia calva]